MLSKMRSKIMCFLEPPFGRVLGRVLGEFWEAETLDFRIFFVIFSMQNFDCNFEGPKIEKKSRQDGECENLALDSGRPRLPGERNREGSESSDRGLELDTSSLDLCDRTGAFDKRSYCDLARFAHLRWAAD